MSYLVFIEEDHVYVKYKGLVDGLDIIRLVADEHFINSLRQLQRIIHDFSFCDEVLLGLEDLKEIAVITNVESNFTGKAIGVMIPSSPKGALRIAAFIESVKSPDWTILTATNYSDALSKI